jgi:hypothetical protein
MQQYNKTQNSDSCLMMPASQQQTAKHLVSRHAVYWTDQGFTCIAMFALICVLRVGCCVLKYVSILSPTHSAPPPHTHTHTRHTHSAQPQPPISPPPDTHTNTCIAVFALICVLRVGCCVLKYVSTLSPTTMAPPKGAGTGMILLLPASKLAWCHGPSSNS